ncbi:MAG: NrfD/PsrC family molybdoenzyme membrane anchor subunit [Mariprofundaceae bacterium]
MESLFHIAPYFGHVYPNETVIAWGILIVFYPYMTGLVAGAFTVSSLYHVFGVSALKPIARFALLTALSLMFFVPMPLLLHLGHPERAMNAMLTPHLTSAFAAFGYIAAFYIIVLMLETWFAFRFDIVAMAKKTRGIARMFYRTLSLGSDDVSPNALAYDRKWLWWLAIIGLPSAHILHGYVGFVFGSLKAREWWASDLMPVIFLGSAIISGISILVLLYVGISKWRKASVDQACLRTLTYTLWGFLIFTLVLEFLEFINLVYKNREGTDMVMALLNGPMFGGLMVQLTGSLIALVMLGAMIYRKTTGRQLVAGLCVTAMLVLIAVFAMRWNVVIGGQELSKSMKGLLDYPMPLFGREGLLASLVVFACPFAALWVLARILPPWLDDGLDKPPR